MIEYDKIRITAFCDSKTMDKLCETETELFSNGLRYVKRGIVTIWENNFCGYGTLVIVDDDEHKKLKQYKKEQEELAQQLNNFHDSLDKLISGELV